MKYFKHHCNATDREFLSSLMEEMGHEGYVLWFQFLEVLGTEIDKQIEDFRRQKAAQIRPVMSIGVSWLSKRAKSRPERVLEFAFKCRKAGRFSIARHNRKTGVLTVEVPNFLSNIDEYTRKMINEVCRERGIAPDTVLTHSGVTPDKVRPTPLPIVPSLPKGGTGAPSGAATKIPPVSASQGDDGRATGPEAPADAAPTPTPPQATPAKTGPEQGNLDALRGLAKTAKVFAASPRQLDEILLSWEARDGFDRVKAALESGTGKDILKLFDASGKGPGPYRPPKPRPNPCGFCDGTGKVADHAKSTPTSTALKPCTWCEGTGKGKA